MNIPQEKLDKYIKKIHAPVCQLCGSNNWTFTDTVFQAPEFFNDKVVFNSKTYPFITLTCTNCGNTFFINAIVAGVVDRKPSPVNSNKGQNEGQNGERYCKN